MLHPAIVLQGHLVQVVLIDITIIIIMMITQEEDFLFSYFLIDIIFDIENLQKYAFLTIFFS
jgi:hypothetical protein